MGNRERLFELISVSLLFSSKQTQKNPKVTQIADAVEK